jgi:PIN domain nuclease of toxin-antitoxin system
MNRFLIDTHILLWLILGDARLNKNIREDIYYFQHPYYVSVETLREIVILQSLKRINFGYSLAKTIGILAELQMTILPVKINHVQAFEKLPFIKPHDDPFDRMLIAQAIAERYALVSADTKFPLYRDCGLELLENTY